MPLQDALPVIDDRTFDQIVAEARTRIARYTPEWTPVWTDVNDNDPGITLVHLHAWMIELFLYRAGSVPELNYIKFLQLLGIELNAAQPATAQVTFPVSATFPGQSVIVPMRTQLSATPSGGGNPLIFETDKALVAVKAPLAAVFGFDGYSPTSLTQANSDATQEFLPFGAISAAGSALILGFDAPGGFPQLDLDIAFWSSPAGSRPAPARCGLSVTRAYPPATLAWQYFDGQDWQPLLLLKDETLAFTITGHVVLRTPAASLFVPQTLIFSQAKLCWLRAFLQKSQYAQPPTLLAIRTNTVGVTQAETITDESLGGSNGARNQVFQLANAPVLHGSLHLEIDEGSGPVEWTQVDDFFSSGPNDQVYVLDETTAQVRTGDGINGAIPVAFAANPDGNVTARDYRTGGGTAGNLPAGAISTLATSVTGIDESNVSNLFPASGGSDEETLDSAKERAPLAIKSRCRAVTAEDYEYLATQVADVKRAKALPLYHPDFPTTSVPGAVTVIVVPDGGPNNPMPLPSDGTLRTVCAYLDQRRLLCAELYVIPPTYQQVTVQGQVTAADSADLAAASDAIEAALLAYFHPITGGDDGQGWPFGGTIYYSRVYQLIMNVNGVASIQSLTITVDGQAAPVCTDVPIAPDALVYSTIHNVQVNYATGP